MTIMEVEILSKKMVKPAVTTPHHLKTYNLSFFDQLAPPDHVPIIYFYSSSSNSYNIREQLVKSLSKTLTQFYPLAGRFVLDGFYVDCNDEGVLYLEAEVNLQLHEFLEKATKNIQLVNDLVPRKNFGKTHSFTTPIMGLQVSFFKCGGVAICMHLSHVVADGYTAAAFIKEWASTTSGLINGTDQRVSSYPTSFDFASVFPSRDLSMAIRPALIPSSKIKQGKVVTKRFLFDENAISTLKGNVNKSENINRPTRVEVVTSVLWKALISMSKLPQSTLYLHLNLRGRTGITTPTVLDNASSLLGNFYMHVPTKFKAKNEKLELHELVKLLRSSLRNSLGKCSEISSANDLFLEAAKYVNEIQEDMGNEEVDVRLFTTLCRMPVYETEFGWGKPEWVTIPEMPLEIVFMLDTKCGTGIEAMVSLNENDMIQFEIDPTITAFTS